MHVHILAPGGTGYRGYIDAVVKNAGGTTIGSSNQSWSQSSPTAISLAVVTSVTCAAILGTTGSVVITFRTDNSTSQVWQGGFADIELDHNGTHITPSATYPYGSWGIVPGYTYYRQSAAAPAGQQYDALDWAGGTTPNVLAAQMEWHVPVSDGGELGAGVYTSELRVGTALGADQCADLAGAESILFNSSGTKRTALLCPHTAIEDPPTPSEPDRPADLPDASSYTCSTTADICTLLNYLLEDNQHLFASLSSIYDLVTAFQSDVDTRLDAMAITLSDTFEQASTAAIEAGVAADRAALLITNLGDVSDRVDELLTPPLDVLVTYDLDTGDNVLTLPLRTHAIRIDLVEPPEWWGYRGLTVREYEPLGHLTVVAAGGASPVTLIRWRHSMVATVDIPGITGAVVNLLPPLTGTATILGKA